MSAIKSRTKNLTDVVNPRFSQSKARVVNRVKSPKKSKRTEQTFNGKKMGKSGSSGSTITLSTLENPQDLPSVVVAITDNPHIKEPSIPVIGFNLSTLVLLIISGFILFLVLYLSVKEFDASSYIQIPTETNISDSTYSRKVELIRMIQEEKKSNREFTIQTAQMVLLNLLLPVLTAILGYIFASNKKE